MDAPLDDANVDRFCNLLSEMRKRTETRFIAITHNPVTMSRMDRLFGVTMPERGISQLVSVDLRQAEALAAGSRRGGGGRLLTERGAAGGLAKGWLIEPCETRSMTETIFDAFPKPPCAELLGWRLISIDWQAQSIRIGFTARPEFLNPAGYVQGGLLAAMLDDVMGPAALVMSEGRLFTSTLDMTVSFLAPAAPRPADRRGSGDPARQDHRLPAGRAARRGRRADRAGDIDRPDGGCGPAACGLASQLRRECVERRSPPAGCCPAD